MGRFGEELRKERLARGIALEEITEATKVSSRHLLALEQEQFRQLPGGVFNKGIVRSYARVVGLDEDAWVGRFMNAYQESGAVTDDDASWIEFAENVGKSRPAVRDQGTERLRWAGVIVLIVILAVVAYFVVGYVKKKEEFAHSSTTSQASRLVLQLKASQIPQPLS
jgi:cytoskeleton protein RodZ